MDHLGTLSSGLIGVLLGSASALADGADVNSTGLVHIPAIERGAPRAVTVEDLAGLRDIDTFTLSPDLKYAAFSVRQAIPDSNSYKTGWFVAETEPGHEIREIGSAGNPQMRIFPDGNTNGELYFRPAKWSPDGQWVAYLYRKDSEVQLWRSRRDGVVQEQLTRGAADVLGFVWGSDGANIYLIKRNESREAIRTTHEQRDAHGYLLDQYFLPDNAQSEPVTHAVRSDKERGGIIPLDEEDVGPTDLWIYKILSHQERPASAAEVNSFNRITRRETASRRHETVTSQLLYPSLTASDSRGRIVAWLAFARENDRATVPAMRVFAAPTLARAKPLPCPAVSCSGHIRGLWWSEDSQEVIFHRGEGIMGFDNAIYAWSISRRTVRRILSTQDFLWQCSLGHARLVCLHESVTTPRRIVAIRLNDGGMEVLADPNPEFRNIQLGEVQRFEWVNTFGRSAFGHLLKPLNYERGKKYPLVVVTYRSNDFIRGGVGDEVPAHVLAANGFAVLSYDIGDSDWSEELQAGQDQQAIDNARWGDSGLREFHGLVDGLDAGLDTIRKTGLIDEDRLGVTGLSTGSTVVFSSLLFSRYRYAAAIASSPPPDPIAAYLQSFSYLSGTTVRGFGNPDGRNGESWKKLSIAQHLDKFHTPLLMQLADREMLYAMQTVAAMTDHKKPFEEYIYPDEFHTKRWPAHRLTIYQLNLDWLAFWLKGEEDPNPAKAEQYVRWRKLREMQKANEAAAGSVH